jgi:hypothetical protein
MKKRQSKRETWWVLTVQDGKKLEFLYATGGDWGPAHLPTSDLTEAAVFDSEQDALRSEAKRGWPDAIPIEIEVRTIVKIV